MFEFSIKSSKNIKELNIIFEDSDGTEIQETVKVPEESNSKEIPKRINKSQKSEELLSFDDLESNNEKNLIVPKPEIPEASINVAEELHNLDF